jgi:hypothetical protein
VVLLHILEIEDRKLYLDLGYPSMFAYLTQAFKYSEASAYTRLSSARLLRHVPEATQKLANGSINLTQLTQLQKCLKHQEQCLKRNPLELSASQIDDLSLSERQSPPSARATLKIIEQLENKNGFETKQILAKTFDMPMDRQEKLNPQKDHSVRLEVTLSAEQFADLELAKSLSSHVCHTGAWADVISYLAQSYNKKKFRSSTELRKVV